MMCTQVAILIENIGVAALLCAATTRSSFQQHLHCSVYTTLLYSTHYTLYTILTCFYYPIIHHSMYNLQRLCYAIRQFDRLIQCINVKCSHS